MTCSASCRQTFTRKKLVSPSRQLSPSLIRAVTARRKLATRLPLAVCLSSGLSVRLPVMVTWVSAMAALLGALGMLLAGRSWWWSGRGARASFLGWWVSRCRRGWGSLAGPPRSSPPACWSGAAPRPPRATGSLRAAWQSAGSRAAVGGPAGTRSVRSALDAGGGQVAARPAGNRPVRAWVQGSRARRRRRGRSLPPTTAVGTGRPAAGLVVGRPVLDATSEGTLKRAWRSFLWRLVPLAPPRGGAPPPLVE